LGERERESGYTSRERERLGAHSVFYLSLDVTWEREVGCLCCSNLVERKWERISKNNLNVVKGKMCRFLRIEDTLLPENRVGPSSQKAPDVTFVSDVVEPCAAIFLNCHAPWMEEFFKFPCTANSTFLLLSPPISFFPCVWFRNHWYIVFITLIMKR
jgi:hypothetical protein